MKIIVVAALGLLLACASPGLAQKYKNKNKEKKDKRFETVVRQNPSDYAGRYTGFDAEHYIEVATDAGGSLTATSFEGARRATLKNIRLDGARLTATKVYEDGTTRDFAATFSNRIMNGTTTFGMIVEEPLTVSPSVMMNRVFYRRE